MNHVDLLGVDLKSDFLCDLFETYDVDVVYSYDRLHEGAADEYRASIPALGLELIFGQRSIGQRRASAATPSPTATSSNVTRCTACLLRIATSCAAAAPRRGGAQ